MILHLKIISRARFDHQALNWTCEPNAKWLKLSFLNVNDLYLNSDMKDGEQYFNRKWDRNNLHQQYTTIKKSKTENIFQLN